MQLRTCRRELVKEFGTAQTGLSVAYGRLSTDLQGSSVIGEDGHTFGNGVGGIHHNTRVLL